METTVWDVLMDLDSPVYDVAEDAETLENFDFSKMIDEFPFSTNEQMYEHLMNTLLTSEHTTAASLIEGGFCILWNNPMFELADISTLSCGMLSRIGFDGGAPTKDILCSILIPNLYCVLLLSANGQWRAEGEVSLQSLWKSSSNFSKKDSSYPELCRTLKNFPDILKSLFIRSDTSNRKYNVCTQYPELFLMMVDAFKNSPLASKEKTALSFFSNKKFYDLCMNVITPNNNWIGTDKIEQPLMEYYLFERLFRLNTKINLAQADYSSGGKSGSALSPSLLADFFFSSPLVFFPKRLLTSLYSTTAGQYDIKSASTFLHFLFQLSSYWFPTLFSFFRSYMRRFNITTYQSVRQFLFPNPGDFENFMRHYISLESNLLSESITDSRSFQTHYKQRWGRCGVKSVFQMATLLLIVMYCAKSKIHYNLNI